MADDADMPRLRKRVGPAHPWWLILWLGMPLALWLIAVWLPFEISTSTTVQRLYRDLGYLVLACMLVAYLYVWRRLQLHQHRGNMTRWMRWHIGASYCGFALMVIHGQGDLFRLGLTTWITILFALVIISGLIGLAAQRWVFRSAALVLDREVGWERLEVERERLIANARNLVENYSLLTEFDIKNWPALCGAVTEPTSRLHQVIWKNKWFSDLPKQLIREVVAGQTDEPRDKPLVVEALNKLLHRSEFCKKQDFASFTAGGEVEMLLQKSPKDLTLTEIERRNRLYLELLAPELFRSSTVPPTSVERFFKEMVENYLESDFPAWRWFLGDRALEPVPRNHYLRVRSLAAPEQAAIIDQLWEWVERRRMLNLEYGMHRLARSWLWLHGPAAWVLLVLIAGHVMSSVYYGGWF